MDSPLPFLLLLERIGANHKRLLARSNDPSVLIARVVIHRLDADFVERNDLLCRVHRLLDNNAAVHQNVAEEEELALLGSLSADLCQRSLAEKHSTGRA